MNDTSKSQPGVMILSQALGNVEGSGLGAGLIGANATGKSGFKHNTSTFQAIWREIEQRTETRWDCRVSIDGVLGADSGARNWDNARARRLVFEMETLILHFDLKMGERVQNIPEKSENI